MNTWLLLAGEYAPPGIAPAAHDRVIAVDGGIRHAARLGCAVERWIGDFDSCNQTLIEQYAHVPRHIFPADKGQTDFELALAYVAEYVGDGILHIVGSGGAEADHAFANLYVLPQSTLPCVLWQKNAVIVAGRGALNVHFTTPKEAKVSLFALTTLYGVTYRGLRWPLNNAVVQVHSALATRNELTADTAQVRWQQGMGLLFLPCTISALEIDLLQVN